MICYKMYHCVVTVVCPPGLLTFFLNPEPGLNSRKSPGHMLSTVYCWLCFALLHEFSGYLISAALNYLYLRENSYLFISVIKRNFVIKCPKIHILKMSESVAIILFDNTFKLSKECNSVQC